MVTLCDPSDVIPPLKLWNQAPTEYPVDTQIKNACFDYLRAIQF
jgi:hypothetical protein